MQQVIFFWFEEERDELIAPLGGAKKTWYFLRRGGFMKKYEENLQLVSLTILILNLVTWLQRQCVILRGEEK